MKTPKGAQTRQRIVERALELFERRGYAETTMSDIADAAGVSIGLAYRYFDRKEGLALALYEQLSEEVARRVKLPDGSVGERWAALELMRFKVLGPHRRTLLALLQAALDPEGELGALSPATAGVRARWVGLHRSVVEGATGSRAPAEELARVLYAIDLLLVMYWMQDRTANGRATREAIGRMSRFVDMAVAMPGVAGAIAELAKSFHSLASPKETT
ncbi:MAG: TetR/AcrR family transcriptional regulator [Myxococcota bacterium]|nr:TetR/AcrR family transcriptional regulator [Myxococcota bacterium]